jgi:uracil DNA glycosylase
MSVFITAPFIIGQWWKQPCSSTDEHYTYMTWLYMVLYIHNEILFCHKNEWNSNISMIWINLESIILNVINQTQNNIVLLLKIVKVIKKYWEIVIEETYNILIQYGLLLGMLDQEEDIDE